MKLRVLLLLVVFSFACREKTPAAHVRVLDKNIRLPFGRCTPITLEWNMLRPLDDLDGKPVVYVHLLLPPHDTVRTFDHPFPVDWRAGSKHTYKYDLCQSIDAPRINPGSYIISVGLYDSADGERWPLSADGREVGTFEYAVADVQATDEGNASRSIQLTGGWGPLTSADDRQIVARRMIQGPSASIVMTDKVSDTLRLGFGVNGNALTVTNTCAPGETRSVPAGFHTFEFPACAGGEIRIERNGSKATLESVAWK